MLNPDEWLRQAKSLAIGSTKRIRHGRESRCNMVVGNKADRWYSYCHACHEGGVVQKESVRLEQADNKSLSAMNSVSLPTDLRPVSGIAMMQAIQEFLIEKHMDIMYFGTSSMWYSDTARRLIIATGNGRMGRYLGKQSGVAKWLTYSAQTWTYAGVLPNTGKYIIVEDTFSMFKVKFALEALSPTPYRVIASLGTSISRELLLLLLDTASEVLVFYDGDTAGLRGARVSSQRLNSLGIRATYKTAPLHSDPKDMTLADIATTVKEAFDGITAA